MGSTYKHCGTSSEILYTVFHKYVSTNVDDVEILERDTKNKGTVKEKRTKDQILKLF